MTDVVNVGTATNSGNGDPLRTAFVKINAKFDLLEALAIYNGQAYSNEGAWLTATAYAVNDLVAQGGVVYACLIAHTSGTFSTDLAAARWVVHQGITAAELASAIGAGLVGLEIDAAYPAGTVGAKLGEVISIKDAPFNAVGDGVTDDSAAFAAAYEYAMSRLGAGLPSSTLYLPAGDYLITDDNFLGALDFTSLPGAFTTKWHFALRGDGWSSNIIWRPSGSSDVWMYDNGASGGVDNRLIYPKFQNLQITHDVADLTGAAKLHGFRCFGEVATNGAVQNFRFENVRFAIYGYGNVIDTATRARFGTFLQLLGSVNASENGWTNCVIQGWETLLDVTDNPNALNNNFINTDVELITGDVFKLSGGASVNVWGGSWLMESETVSYLFALRQDSIALTGSYLFQAGRTEFRVNSLGTYLSRWLLTDATGFASAYNSSFPTVKFIGWASPTSGTARVMFRIDAALPAKITLAGCSLADVGVSPLLHQLEVFSSKAGLQAANTSHWMAELAFVDGDAVPFDLVTFTDANSTAKISARNCRNTIDYDLTANGISDQITGRMRNLKSATLWGPAWPDVGDPTTMELRLPVCLLKKAMFRKAANGGAATAGYQIALMDGAGNVYCASTIAAQNVEHKGLADNLNIYMDDDEGYAAGVSATQTIFMSAVSGQQGSSQAVPMAPTDYALVEYY